MSTTKAWLRAIEYTRGARGQSLPALFDGLAETHGDRIALLDAQEALSYRDLQGRANQIARYARTHGVNSGDVVCLLMPNCPDYVAIWLGLTRLGCTVALLNTNLCGDALIHCIQVARADVVIAGDVRQHLPFHLPVKEVWNWSLIKADALRFSASALTAAYPRSDERALLIYTSGTTGLPKATNITHARIVEWSYWFAGLANIQPSDRVYNCLPMYHSTGGIVAVGMMLVRGASVFIRRHFSSSQFWDEVCDRDCTIFQYIGELCRYLTLQPTHVRERDHKLRLACGNGMHHDVWQNFQDRFALPQVLEFFAATEGNLSLYNVEGKVGAVGRVPRFLQESLSVALVQVDVETGTLVRNEHGFCIRCGIDEPGEAISDLQGRRFDGYTDSEASAKKVIRDVFMPGDVWFRSGDLMRQDAQGYFYWVDRLGDTFRWKGENVATSEVAAVIRRVPGVIDTVVYGVPIPGTEGRAGMAAMTITPDFSFATLAGYLREHLPSYAHPLFIRVCHSLTTTGTFKLSKTQLIAEGYTGTADPIWAREQDGSYSLSGVAK